MDDGEFTMSWDVDEKEFYETFAEIESGRGIEDAKRWAWSALDWTQKELRNQEVENKRMQDEINRLKEHRESCAENLLKGYRVGKEESIAAVVSHLRERAIHGAGNIVSVEDACTILAGLFERGGHRREE